MKNKCDCYRVRKILHCTPFYTKAYYETVGICNGTREQDECSCNGDRTKCNFYPEIRKKAKRETERVVKITTNADNIRSMNNKELAEFLESQFMEDICHKGMCLDGETCIGCVLKWLEQPAEKK